MKKNYMRPDVLCQVLSLDSHLMAGSGERGTTIYTDEPAPSGEGGLARRRRTVWDDDEEELEEEQF